MSPRDLPDNLQADTKRLRTGETVTYYRYVFPDGRRRAVGRNRDAAIQAARVLNDRTAAMRAERRQAELLAAADNPLSVGNPLFAAVADAYLAERTGHLAAASALNRRREIQAVKKAFGSTPIQTVRTYDVAQFLKRLAPHAQKAHRNALRQIFIYAMEEGFAHSNPVDNTRPARQPARRRKRHTWDGFQAILEVAPDWLQHTMWLALFSLQRRGDLLTLTWDKVDMDQRLLDVRQSKTGTWLHIRMGDELYRIFEWFYTTEHACPYVVHRQPRRRTRRLLSAVRRGEQHLLQVTRSALSHAFQDARDASGYYDHLPASERPAFHDLRALGIFALAKAGYPEKYIQALAGHADVEMTRFYMQGHEQVRPVAVEAGLTLDAVDWSQVDWDETLSPQLQTLIDTPQE